MRVRLFVAILGFGMVVTTGVSGADRPLASRNSHYFVHRSSSHSHMHLILPGEWAGQTFQASSTVISDVWIMSDADPDAITVEVLEYGTGSLVGTGTTYRRVGRGIRAEFAPPLMVHEGVYYLLKITTTAPLELYYSNYDDYPIGDGRLHNTGDCCVHGDDLNARIIG